MIRLLLFVLFFVTNLNCKVLFSDECRFVIVGVIVDSQKKPVANADVFAVDQMNFDVQNHRARTDSGGRYSIELENSGMAMLIVQKDGWAITSQSIRLQQHQPSDNAETANGTVERRVDFELQPGKNFSVEFVDPNDQPIAIEAAHVNYCNNETQYISFRGDMLKMKTAGSQVFVESIPDNSYMSLKISSQSFGSFDVVFPHNFRKEKIKIVADCVVEGIAMNLKGEPISDINLALSNWHSTGGKEKPDYSISTTHNTKTGLDGRFQFKVARGGNWIQAETDEYYLADSEQFQSVPDETVSLDLKLNKTCEIVGRVVDEQGNGVAGVKLNVSSRIGSVTSDEEGNFSFKSTRNPAYISYSLVPDGFVRSHVHRAVEFEDDKAWTKAKDIVLESSMPVSGTVVDEKNNAVAGARVTAKWQQKNGRTFTGASDFAVSDSLGRFTLRNASRNAQLGLVASSVGAATCAVKLVNIDDERENVKLKVETAGLIGIKGTIVDSTGKPVNGAAIALKEAQVLPSGYSFGESKIFANIKCLTNSRGQFEFPNKLARTGKYSVSVTADGFSGFESQMLSAESGKTFIELKNIQINKTVSVSGKIVDHEGKPVHGAKITGFGVRQRGTGLQSEKSVLSNDRGSFNLKDLHPNCRILFISKEGYRFRGFSLSDNKDEFFVLENLSSPSQEKPLNLNAKGESNQQHLQRLVEEKLALGRPGQYASQVIFRMTKKSHPKIVHRIANTLPDNALKAGILFAIGEFDEATEIAASQTTPKLRMRAFQLGALEVDNAETKGVLLRESAAHATAIQDAGTRIEAYGSLIEAMYDSGDVETAKALSQRALPVGMAHGYEGRGSFARGWLAKATVEMYPEESVSLISEIKDPFSFDRHHANLAHEMAALNPEFAEQQMAKIKNPESRIAKVVYRMGPVDLKRALSLIDNTKFRDTKEHANALGVLAYTVRESAPEKARELLKQAIEKMEVEQDHRYTLGTAVNLLRFACEVDSRNANQYFWKMLKLYSDPNSDAWGANEAKSAAQLRVGRQALLLALFDKYPEVQKELLLPILDDFRDFSDKNDQWFTDMTNRGHLFVAMSLALPEETLQWCNWYYENISPDKARYLPQPWEVIGWTFAKSPVEVTNYAVGELLHSWAIDNEDL